jgi:hypothetical protein
VLIEGGAELEIGWLPPLLEGARKGKILAGAPGHVASEGVQLLDIPLAADRSRGDTHVAGNPHFMLDPLNARIVARHLVRVLGSLDPPGATFYDANLADFESQLETKMAEWTAASRALRWTPRRHLPPDVALFWPPFRAGRGHVPRAQARHSAFSAAPGQGDAEDAGRRHPRSARRALPASQDRRGGGRADECGWSTSASSREAFRARETYVSLIDAVVRRIAEAFATHP